MFSRRGTSIFFAAACFDHSISVQITRESAMKVCTDRPTDQLDGALPFKLIDQYARPMTIKNTIKNAIDYFYMEAPSAMVSMKVDT